MFLNSLTMKIRLLKITYAFHYHCHIKAFILAQCFQTSDSNSPTTKNFLKV